MVKNILIVDDCGTTRKILAHYLSTAGYEIVQASNGFDAVEKLSGKSVDLIVTDLNMPQMDGMELVMWVRSHYPSAPIPILMLTTEADETRKLTAIKAGVFSFLSKPVTRETLVEEIKKVGDFYVGRE